MAERTRDPKRYHRLTEDIRKLSSFLAAGKPPVEALLEFQRLIDIHRLRDRFAAVALRELVKRVDVDGKLLLPETVARVAYDYADAMLAERGG